MIMSRTDFHNTILDRIEKAKIEYFKQHKKPAKTVHLTLDDELEIGRLSPEQTGDDLLDFTGPYGVRLLTIIRGLMPDWDADCFQVSRAEPYA